ncbi:hypothetical protein FRB96_003863 [Tulasnella sp. 330]|nr:hypothetical protein FRB96_003863 [Tulasnella sp. 330]KAG8872142.1 hypothetical protein FRB97_008000 [Tulasnella sp. 331]KAG8875166.1 hypothetical protein FRB98_008054 [Tulasnella sp. 332]
MSAKSNPQVIVYSTTPSGHQLKLDAHLPSTPIPEAGYPVVVSFHGGGLFCGSRNDFLLNKAIKDRFLSKGIVLISADTRLLLPHHTTASAFPVDVAALFAYLASDSFHAVTKLDVTRLALIGYSAGAHMARISAIELSKPHLSSLGWKVKALASEFGMGGQYLDDHNIAPKNQPRASRLSMGINKLVMYEEVSKWLDVDQAKDSEEVSEIPFSFVPGRGLVDAQDASTLIVYLREQGTWIDVLTGSEGLSSSLRALPLEDRPAAIPDDLKPFFPQLNINASFPPTYLVHGDADSYISVNESINTKAQLDALGIENVLVTVPGAEHGLMSQVPGAGAVKEAAEVEVSMVEWVAEKLL